MQAKDLILRVLNENDETAFFQGLKEWDGEDLSWYTFEWKRGLSFPQLLRKLEMNTQGLDLPEGWLPSTALYGFVNGAIVGRLHIRHQLNDDLRRRGGHIGYAVAPRFRRHGFGNEMFRQALPICKSLGIEEILVTCADENEPSYRILERFGARLADKIWDDVDQEMIRRYWLKT